VLNHNIEVVRRLFPKARPQGSYERSLGLLRAAKELTNGGAINGGYGATKSGLMVGLGETKEEIIQTMGDLCSVTDIFTLGQYLQPTKNHLPVIKYYTPEEFKEFKEIGERMGFKHVESGPLVRSSYHAGEYGNIERAQNGI